MKRISEVILTVIGVLLVVGFILVGLVAFAVITGWSNHG